MAEGRLDEEGMERIRKVLDDESRRCGLIEDDDMLAEWVAVIHVDPADKEDDENEIILILAGRQSFPNYACRGLLEEAVDIVRDVIE